MAGEVGIEWVKKYHGRAANLTNTQAQAEGFYNVVPCTQRFNWGDDLAWDQDFEEPGTDNVWIDTVDIAFFSGHGGPNGPLFGVTYANNGHTSPAEARWGNIDLEWIAFDACSLLRFSGVFNRWRQVFQGLHFMLGFETGANDERYRGFYFAFYLSLGWSIRNAWFKACQLTAGSSIRTAYLRAMKSGANTYNDHLWGRGNVSSDPDPPGVILAYCSTPC